jgi:tRNA(fMet)-specific endonuclease VapC
MLVLDTDTLTMVQRRSGELYDRLDARLQASAATEVICVTIVSFEEQMRGWLAYVARARTTKATIDGYRRLHDLFDDFHLRYILDFDSAAADRFAQLARARVRIGTMDLRIAAIALAHDAILLSRNLQDFRKVPGLRVEDWTLP